MAVVVGTTASLAFISVRWPQESRDDTGILHLQPSLSPERSTPAE